jgi:uncharacterized protein (DUF2062 family)
MFDQRIETARIRVAGWLRQGLTPRRLAFTLALGLAVGCMPIVGVTTLACAVLAVALRLNLPALQAANYAAFPFQLALIVPFVRLGQLLLPTPWVQQPSAVTLLHISAIGTIGQLGRLAGGAVLAWVLVAVPMVLLLTAVLTPLLRRVQAVARAGDEDN